MLAGPTEPLGCNLSPRLICNSQVSVSVLHPRDLPAASAAHADSAGLCPGEMVIDRLIQSVRQRQQQRCALAPSLPWLVLREGMRKTNLFTVLCQIMA